MIAVIPSALASKLPPDLFRRARNQRVHALAPNDVLEVILGVRVLGADAPHLQQLALEHVEKMSLALSRRTVPTVVDRRLFMELLVDASVGEHVRSLAPSALLAGWVKEPPVWSENVRKLVTRRPADAARRRGAAARLGGGGARPAASGCARWWCTARCSPSTRTRYRRTRGGRSGPRPRSRRSRWTGGSCGGR